MAANLLSLVMQTLTPDMIAKIASALGIDRNLAQRAIAGAVPALLAGLADIGSTPSGARQLSNVVARQPGPLDSLKSLFEGGDQQAITDAGSNMLAGLFGGGAFDALTAAIGKFTGLSNNSTKTILGMLAPVLLGTLGQQQRSAGLDAAGLGSMLASQKDQVERRWAGRQSRGAVAFGRRSGVRRGATRDKCRRPDDGRRPQRLRRDAMVLHRRNPRAVSRARLVLPWTSGP
jgi:hypothetical protein